MSVDGEINSKRMGNKVWLVKMPRWLAEHWDDVSFNGREIGKLHITQKQGERPDCQILLPDTQENADIPKHLLLKINSTEVTNTFTFSETENGQASAIEGTVWHEASVMPVLSADYKRVHKTRAMRTGQLTRTVKIVDQAMVNRAQALTSSSKKDEIYFRSYAKPKNDPDQRRERLEKSELIDMLMLMFAEYPYWNMKGLLDRTKQPQVHLRTVLDSIAKLNKNGPYTGTYSLKPEFTARLEETAKRNQDNNNAKVNASATHLGADNEQSDSRDGESEEGDDDEEEGHGYDYDDEMEVVKDSKIF